MAQIMIVEDSQGTNKAICEYINQQDILLFLLLTVQKH